MMKDALGKWLDKQGVEVGVDTAQSLCHSLGLDSEKKDACLGLVYRFEKDEIGEPEFMQGLLLLSGKSPEELSDSMAKLSKKEVGTTLSGRVIKPRTEFEKKYARRFEYKGREIWHFPHKPHIYAIPREIRIGLGTEPHIEELTTYREIWSITKSPVDYSTVDDFVVLSSYEPDMVYNHLTWLVKNQQAIMNIDRMGNAVYIKLLR